jgi:hypothetical protein
MIWVEHHFQQCFSYVIFIDGANWNTKRKLLTCYKTLINFITLSSIESNLPHIGIKFTDVTMTVGTKFIGRL